MKRIYLAGGCFWGVEKYLSLIPGVLRTETGYANGEVENPTYEDVRYRESGHAETVLVEYDPARLPLPLLLDVFYRAIDPTSVDKQGEDEGRQYRTGIYYEDEEDGEAARASLAALAGRVGGEVAVERVRLRNYWPAEEYHQKYLDKNPNGYCHIGQEEFDALRGYLDGLAETGG
ncbi:MAG: peptide-methionine (S)-S-oxide reductase MsrA [Clostridiales Family XIII bacterium]|jgi:peptide methionine sulfoxide reductase msrA/msrB|nr:peptide-methionine (S)-S-oxide reductase MsrA [Clostridiales Family XIII bacterium]